MKPSRGITFPAVSWRSCFWAACIFKRQRICSAQFLLGTLAVVILVIIGTYFFFGSFLSVFLRYLINNKKIMYQGVRIVGITNIAFRLRGNYRSLAILAVMAATAITAFGTSLSLKYYVDQTHAIEFPYSFS